MKITIEPMGNTGNWFNVTINGRVTLVSKDDPRLKLAFDALVFFK